MSQSKTIYVLVPVKAQVLDGQVRLIECPSLDQVAEQCEQIGFWEDTIGAEVYLRYGKSACEPCTDKILKG